MKLESAAVAVVRARVEAGDAVVARRVERVEPGGRPPTATFDLPLLKRYGGELARIVVTVRTEGGAAFDLEGIDLAVLFPPGSGEEWAMDDPGFAAAMCRTLNDARAEYASHAPDRLKLVAKLPMIEPSLAAEELERCVTQHGFVGMVTATHIREKNLDDPSFDRVWATAERLGVAVCTHGGGQAPGQTPFAIDRYDTRLGIHALVLVLVMTTPAHREGRKARLFALLEPRMTRVALHVGAKMDLVVELQGVVRVAGVTTDQVGAANHESEREGDSHCLPPRRLHGAQNLHVRAKRID